MSENENFDGMFSPDQADSFTVTALLADHVETKNGLLYVLGGGVSQVLSAHGAPAPYIVNLGIGAIVGVPWSKTNSEHTFTVRLVDEDSQPIFLPTPDGSVVPARADIPFTVLRPDHLPAGTEQLFPMALNFPGLAFQKLGTYVFLVMINEVERTRLVVHVDTLPA